MREHEEQKCCQRNPEGRPGLKPQGYQQGQLLVSSMKLLFVCFFKLIPHICIHSETAYFSV